MPITRVHDAQEAQNALRSDADVVVCVPVFEAYDEVVKCLASLIEHTSPACPILVLDDGSTEPRLRSLRTNSAHDIVLWHRDENMGFVATVNSAFRVTGRSDVVVVNSDVVVGPQWLERLRDAAYSLSTVATATPLTNNGTVLSVGNGPGSPSSRLPDGLLPGQAAQRVAQYSKRLRPLVPTAIGHCTYFRRSALDVVGGFDDAFSPGYSEEVDFSQRALASGLVHVCADDVFVFHQGNSSFGRSQKVNKLIDDHDQLIAKRYPYYFNWVRQIGQDAHSRLSAALLVADSALRGMHLLVDGWCLGPTVMGTQVVVLESVKALVRHPDVSEVTVAASTSISPSSRAELESCGARVLLAGGPEHLMHLPVRTDLVYRPYQVTRMGELEWLLKAAPRVVIGQLDCIAYNDPAYFADLGQWSTYRRVSQLASYCADALTFLSYAGLAQAGASGLLPAGTATSVVYAGTDVPISRAASKAPTGASATESGFFLCLGTSYKHKNRVLAMRIWATAREHGFKGGLVLAGPTPPYGNSLADEDAFLIEHAELAGSVRRIGAVSDEEKEWLYGRAALVLYPTLSEGFGLVPFEAAHHGVPCLSTRAGALDEVLPKELPVIDPGDVPGAAELALQLAAEGPLRESVCEALRSRSAEFTWDRTANRLVELFWEVLGRPTPELARDQHLLSAPGLRVGREVAARHLKGINAPIAWAVRQVAEHPALRRLMVPAGSSRLRLGTKVVGWLDRRVSER